MKLSIGSWAFVYGPYARNPVSFDQTARRLAAAGLDGIEICGSPPHVTIEKYQTRASRLEVVTFLQDLGLSVSGYAADLTFANPTVAGNEKRYFDLFARNADLCADISSPAIRVDTASAPGSIPAAEYDSAFDRLAHLWRDCAEYARKAGIRVVWEFEPGFEFNKPSEVVALYEAVGHPNFYVLFDTCHAFTSGVAGARQRPPRETVAGVAEYLRLLGGRIGAIHLIDSDGTLYGEETSNHRPFGKGKVDFASLAPSLRTQPGVDWWCIDLCFIPGSWDLIEPSVAFVRNLQ
jgi:sugar phosphate isomerase/epimerase